jgi:hypothetical protein
MLRRSQCSLACLELRHLDLTHTDLLLLLTELTTLVELDIRPAEDTLNAHVLERTSQSC